MLQLLDSLSLLVQMGRECFLFFKKLTFRFLEMLLELILVSKSVLMLLIAEIRTLILLPQQVIILSLQMIYFGLKLHN